MPGTIIQDPTTGSLARVVDGKLRSICQSSLYAIAEGLLTGHSEFEQFGYNAAVGTASEDVWGGSTTYSFPAANVQMEVLGAAQDTLAGTGIQKIMVHYLTSGFVEKTVQVDMSGATPVDLAADMYRVNRVHAVQVGTGGGAAGTVTVRLKGGAATSYSIIEAGNTRSRNAIYTVPTGKILYLTSMTACCGWSSTAANPHNSMTFTLRANYDHLMSTLRTFFVPHAEMIVGSGGGFATRNFEFPLVFPAGSDVKVSAFATVTGATASVGLRGWIETA